MTTVSMTQRDSLGDPLEQMHQRIAQRAYELFRGRGTLWGDTFADWFTAEREIAWRPPVEWREKDGMLTIVAALAGVERKDIAIEITSNDIVIRAETKQTETKDVGQVHQSGFVSGQFFRSMHFPKPIETAKAKAEYKNGLLTVTAPVATEAQAMRPDIKAG